MKAIPLSISMSLNMKILIFSINAHTINNTIEIDKTNKTFTSWRTIQDLVHFPTNNLSDKDAHELNIYQNMQVQKTMSP